MATRKLRRGKYRPSNSSNSISGKSRIVRRAVPHRREIDHGKQWYVVRTNPNCGNRARQALLAKGFDVFRPIEDRWRVFKHRCSDVSLEWFGRYLFAGCSGDCGPDKLYGTDGVAGVLGTTEKGALAVRPEVLQAVADQISGFTKPAPAAFSEGQKVTVAVGPFAQLMAEVLEVYPNNSYARVAIEVLGKKHAVELDFGDLKAA